eukprot:4634959-Karenia_brevis.AAC.1
MENLKVEQEDADEQAVGVNSGQKSMVPADSHEQRKALSAQEFRQVFEGQFPLLAPKKIQEIFENVFVTESQLARQPETEVADGVFEFLHKELEWILGMVLSDTMQIARELRKRGVRGRARASTVCCDIAKCRVLNKKDTPLATLLPVIQAECNAPLSIHAGGSELMHTLHGFDGISNRTAAS